MEDLTGWQTVAVQAVVTLGTVAAVYAKQEGKLKAMAREIASLRSENNRIKAEFTKLKIKYEELQTRYEETLKRQAGIKDRF